MEVEKNTMYGSSVEGLNISFQKTRPVLAKEVIFELAFKGCLHKKAERRVISERKHIYIRHRDVIPHGVLG